MKYRRLIGMGILVATLTTQTQAAVYGNLKQEIQINISDNQKITRQAGQGISILEENEHNYLVLVQEDTTEYVSKHLIEIAGVITTTTSAETKLRAEANTDAELLNYLDEGAIVMVLEKENEFYKVKVDGTVGYIYKGQLDTKNLKDVPQKNSTSALGEEIVTYAKKYLGGPYVYGGNNLNTGVDCSGFSSQIMKHFGIYLERSSRAQYSANGYRVSEAEIQPGDLVFYGSNGVNIDHVAIYAGNGQIIHASDSRTGIKMSSLHYGKPLIGIKRVI